MRSLGKRASVALTSGAALLVQTAHVLAGCAAGQLAGNWYAAGVQSDATIICSLNLATRPTEPDNTVYAPSGTCQFRPRSTWLEVDHRDIATGGTIKVAKSDCAIQGSFSFKQGERIDITTGHFQTGGFTTRASGHVVTETTMNGFDAGTSIFTLLR